MNNEGLTPPCRLPRDFIAHVAPFLDPQCLGNVRIRPEDDATSDGSKSVRLDLDAHSYLLHQEDYDALCQMHRQLKDGIRNALANKNAPADEKERNSIDLVGYCVTAKIILLIQALLVCHNYYNVPTERYPDFKPSSLLDPLYDTDLAIALRYEKAILVDEPGKHADIKAARMRDIYYVMKTLFDLMTGWLPCAEVDKLRNAYTVFHTTPDGGEALACVNECLWALSARFAKEEPNWERARAGLANGVPQPLIPNVNIPKEAGNGLGAKKKEKKRRGSGLKGTKTKTMTHQLAAFDKWIDNGKEINERDDAKTISARARQYWGAHEPSMEKAAKATDEKRGYKNYKCLADAYRKWIAQLEE